MGVEGAVVADGCVGVDVGGGVYDGVVADGGSGLDDDGGTRLPRDGWWSSTMAVGESLAEGSMEGGSLGMGAGHASARGVGWVTYNKPGGAASPNDLE